LEGEAGDAVGRDYYEHGAQAGQGYRNGYRTGRLKTAEGAIEYSAPQVAGREEPYRSAIREHLKGHTRALERSGEQFQGAAASGGGMRLRALRRGLLTGDMARPKIAPRASQRQGRQATDRERSAR
jgi:hypothetical protein